MSDHTGPLGPFVFVRKTDPALRASDPAAKYDADAMYDAYLAAHCDPAALAPMLREGMKPTAYHCDPLPGSHVMLDLNGHLADFSRLAWYACAASCHRIVRPDGTEALAKGKDLGPDMHGAKRASDGWVMREIYNIEGPAAVYDLGAVVWSRTQLREADRNP